MKLIVCGGRTFNDWQYVRHELDDLHDMCRITLIIHGNATGADTLGNRWAKENGIPLSVYSADWKSFGRLAGPIRNREMAMQADSCIAFPGGRGTNDMVKVARNKGLTVYDRRGGQYGMQV